MNRAFGLTTCCTFLLAALLPAQELRVPANCAAAPGATASPDGYADRVIHRKTGIELVLVPAGAFNMGAAGPGHFSNVAPVHRVTIAKPFYMGRTEVTNAQYWKFLAAGCAGARDCDPAYDLHVRHLRGLSIMPVGDDYPVVFVSWKNAMAFCDWAADLALPTEAEWEYACRAGTETLFSFGDDGSNMDSHGWTITNAKASTQPVAQLQPNPWGLYDLYGNVWEWCLDDYVARYEEGTPSDGSARFADTMTKTLRGGSWSNTILYVGNSASRYNMAPVLAANDAGFRVVLRSE